MVLRLHGYGAWVELGGKSLEEHAVEVKDNVISCYICSEEGKEFILHFDDDGSHFHPLTSPASRYGRALTIKMDGLSVDQSWGDFMAKQTSSGVHADNTIRPYVFAPIDTTDDDDVAAREDPNIEHLGTIQVELKRAIGVGPGTFGFGYQGPVPSTGPIHERSKKAGSHRVALGQAIYKERSTVRVHYLDHTPWLIFRFLYRKRDLLKAQGILPQSPSPPPANLPGPSVKAEVGENEGRGIKRERDDNGGNRDDGVIEIVSDGDDLDTLQDELKRLQDRIARKKAKKSVKRESVSSADDIIDLT